MVCVCVVSKEPVSQEYEEEQYDQHNDYLGSQRCSQVQVASFLPVLPGAHGELLRLVTQCCSEKGVNSLSAAVREGLIHSALQ